MKDGLLKFQQISQPCDAYIQLWQTWQLITQIHTFLLIHSRYEHATNVETESEKQLYINVVKKKIKKNHININKYINK